jgi:ankyrin repeat protein
MSEERIIQLIKTFMEDTEHALHLLDEDPGLVQEKTSLGETALHYLAVENQLEAVKKLYKRGADINTVNDFGGTPLSDAVSLGYVELVRVLLERGARVEGLFSSNEPILHEAVRSGKPEIIHLLIAHGANIHSKNSLDETPLHESAKDDKCFEVTKYLVEHGAIVDALAAFHSTPLNGAALHGATNTAKYLVGVGASLSVKDSKGRTPAQMARECEHEELANWLEQVAHAQI